MKTPEVRDQLIAYTDVILARFAEDVFFEIGKSDTWSKDLKEFVEEKYRTHKGNYEGLHKLFCGNDEVTLGHMDPQSLSIVLQFYPPIKDFYAKTSAKSVGESFEKTVKDIAAVRNSLALFDATYDKEGKKLYFMLFNHLMNLQKLAVMCIEHLDNKTQWLDILDWVTASILEQKLKLE